MRVRLLILRKTSGYTQTQLAEKVGITRQWLGMIENGTVPLNPTIELALCYVLKCEPKDLIDSFQERLIGVKKDEEN